MDTNADSDPTQAAVERVAETAPPASVGKLLSEARIRQGLSIADVAGSIKFAPRQVEALEADDFSHLPELTFLRGFVRSYARLLHMDETSLLDALPRVRQQSVSPQNNLAEVPFPAPQSGRRINAVWLSAALVLALILGVGVWLFQDKPVAKKTAELPVVLAPVEPAVPGVAAASAAAASPQTVSAVSADGVTPAAPPVLALPATPEKIAVGKSAAQGPIHLVFEEESWVDIKDKSGNTLFKQINPPNSEQWIDGRPPFSLVIGNAGGVRLYYEGEEIGLEEFTDVEVARLVLE